MDNREENDLQSIRELNAISLYPGRRQALVRDIIVFLIKKAMHGQTTTYQEVAIAHGLPNTGNQMSMTLSILLGDVFLWCLERRLPHLTALVVRKSGTDQGLPGRGFWLLLDNTDALHEDVGVDASRKVRRALTTEFQRQVFNFWDVKQMNAFQERRHGKMLTTGYVRQQLIV